MKRFLELMSYKCCVISSPSSGWAFICVAARCEGEEGVPVSVFSGSAPFSLGHRRYLGLGRLDVTYPINNRINSQVEHFVE